MSKMEALMYKAIEDGVGLFWVVLNGEIFDGPFLYMAEAVEMEVELNGD